MINLMPSSESNYEDIYEVWFLYKSDLRIYAADIRNIRKWNL